MSGYKILVVEDEEGIRGLIQLFLENRGFNVFPAANGKNALCFIQTNKPDLILLDIEMPQMDGFEVCERIRQMMKVPIIFISSRRGVNDKIKSFNLGGDDYITKPFDFAELEARINANIRRYIDVKGRNPKNILQLNNLSIDLDSLECYVNGELIHLSAREMEILLILAKHPNHVWSAEKLYDHIWGYDALGDVQTVKVHISNLRRKINKHVTDANYIETVRGFGYKIKA